MSVLRRRRKSIASLVALLACMSACASSVEPHEGSGGGLETDWDTWFPHAESVENTDRANAVLPFASDEPNDLNAAPRIFLSPVHDAVAFIYDTQAYGRVVVVESLPDIPDAKEREISYQNQVDQAKSGTVEVFTIRDDLPALVSSAADKSRSAVEFVRGDIQFTILGPNLSTKEALEIAERISQSPLGTSSGRYKTRQFCPGETLLRAAAR
jgi:hypothetical protein